MANEDKIIEMLTNIQSDIATMKADIDTLKSQRNDNKLDDDGVRKQLETLNKMRGLLTQEEADALAASIGE